MNYKIVVSAYEGCELMKDVVSLKKSSVEEIHDCDSIFLIF